MAAPVALEPQLGRLVAEARAAWPGVEVPPDEFARAVQAAVEAAGSGGDSLAGVQTSDLWLARGCALGLPAATRAFVSRYLAAVPRYLAHLEPSAWLAEEVAQELAAKLLVARPPDPPRIASYGGRGPLDSWVAVAAQRAALSLLRRRDPAAAGPRPGDDILGAMSVGLDPERGLARAELKQKLQAALAAALGALAARDRMLLRLSLVTGLSCQKIGRIYGVNASTAARWIARARDLVLDRVERELGGVHGLEPADLGSLLGVARSQIDLSLSGVLAGEPAGEKTR